MLLPYNDSFYSMRAWVAATLCFPDRPPLTARHQLTLLSPSAAPFVACLQVTGRKETSAAVRGLVRCLTGHLLVSSAVSSWGWCVVGPQQQQQLGPWARPA